MKNVYVLLMLLTSLLWGGNFVVAKSLVDHASPLTLTSLRWLIAVAVLLQWYGGKKKITSLSRCPPPFIINGRYRCGIVQYLSILALERTTSTNVGFISTLNTISIAIFSTVFLKEKINVLQAIAMLLSLFGVVLVLSKGISTYYCLFILIWVIYGCLQLYVSGEFILCVINGQ